MDKEDAKFEADVAAYIAKLFASSFNKTTGVSDCKEIPAGMQPVAYAMFEFLVLCGGVFGVDWADFLRCALDECIAKHHLEGE